MCSDINYEYFTQGNEMPHRTHFSREMNVTLCS